MRVKNSLTILSAILPAVFIASAHASCGASFCTLNTNWSTQGVWVELGARLDMRYEYIDQDELLRGENAPDPAAAHHREKETQNRNLQSTLDYNFSQTYGITLVVPWVSREHFHLHTNHHDKTKDDLQSWDFSELGDIKVIGHVQLSPTSSLQSAYGINVGVKLPAGDFEVTNEEGKLAERSLQPGTGTTDAIAGFYFHQQLPGIASQWFAQAQYVTPLNERDDFKSGSQVSLDLGVRHNFTKALQAMLQINFNQKSRDQGDQAEPEDSGGRFVYASPGISYALTPSLQIYSFVHHRLSQNVNGNQLGSKDNFVVGFNTRF
jgi:hypothetical protein